MCEFITTDASRHLTVIMQQASRPPRWWARFRELTTIYQDFGRSGYMSTCPDWGRTAAADIAVMRRLSIIDTRNHVAELGHSVAAVQDYKAEKRIIVGLESS